MSEPTHPRRWRSLRTTPENFQRFFDLLHDEVGEANAGFPLDKVFSFHEQTATFPAYALMVSPNNEIRFLFNPGVQLFDGKRLREIDPSTVASIQWRRAPKVAA